MSHDLGGCSFTAADGQGFSFSVGAYAGPAALGADRRLVQIRLAGIGGELGDFDEIIAMRVLETIADMWLREYERP